MPSPKHLFKISLLSLLVFFASCVKDVDLDQYQEIVIPPVADIDLVYFDLSLDDFSAGPGGDLRAIDETRLEFLDDDYIQKSLMRADFNFRFTNSFQNPFTVNFLFRSENNAIRHQIIANIPAGNVGNPAVVDYSEIIDTSQIEKIRKSIKVSVEVIMHDSSGAPEGNLILESKGTYHFEFK